MGTTDGSANETALSNEADRIAPLCTAMGNMLRLNTYDGIHVRAQQCIRPPSMH